LLLDVALKVSTNEQKLVWRTNEIGEWPRLQNWNIQSNWILSTCPLTDN